MARRKQLTEEQEKEIKLLRANNEMYERTKEEARVRGTKESVSRIELAQKDVQAQINSIMEGNDIDAMKIDTSDIARDDMVGVLVNEEPEEKRAIEGNKQSIFDILEQNREEEEKKYEKKSKVETDTRIESEEKPISYGSEIVNPTDTTFNNVDDSAQYDVISLPSNGECYANKASRIPVAYLTAYDENIITSPNLYRDGLVIDYLLKNKIMNKGINVDELVTGDVDAIVLFLRATSYGVDFPIIVNDPETGEQIETNVDLTTFKPKKFTLKGDENGHFTYIMPKSGDEIKFRYLTRKDENNLALLLRLESKGTIASDLNDVHRVLDSILKEDVVLDPREKSYMLEATRKIKEWSKRVEESNDNRFNRAITNRMEMQIMAVNGNYDREYIKNYIYKMSAGESIKLRKYILANEPGIDFEFEVKRPESLGGGSFKTFLEWNDNVFFNIA